MLIDGFMTKHRQMIKEMRGLPGVMPERLHEANTIRHCALSLVGLTCMSVCVSISGVCVDVYVCVCVCVNVYVGVCVCLCRWVCVCVIVCMH